MRIASLNMYNPVAMRGVQKNDCINKKEKISRSWWEISDAEEAELFKKFRCGDKNARAQIIEAHLRIPVHYALKYACENSFLKYEDLYNTGVIGVIKAADIYDINKGYRFFVLASACAKNEILNTILRDSKTVRVPQRISKNFQVIREFIKTQGKYPEYDEIKDSINISEKNYLLTLQALKKQELSIDAPILGLDSEYADFKDIIADEQTDVEQEVIDNILKARINELLKSSLLNPRESEIIKMRFGFDGEGGKSRQEIGNKYGISKERIRQIEVKAIDKLSTQF